MWMPVEDFEIEVGKAVREKKPLSGDGWCESGKIKKTEIVYST